MNSLPADAVSRYMAWAKLHSNARFNLAISGVMDYPLAELPVQIEDLEIGGTGPYGYEPLMERLAAKAGVPAELRRLYARRIDGKLHCTISRRASRR